MLIFGNSFKSTAYYSTVVIGDCTVTKSPIAIIANNAVGNKTFKNPYSESYYGIKIGKFKSKFDSYKDNSSSVDGPENWTCPHGGFTSLSNATMLEIKLPVLMQNSVFGERSGSRGELYTYSLQERSPMENIIFVDENGYVRQMTKFHMENTTFDLNSTARYTKNSRTVYSDFGQIDKYKDVLNLFKKFFNSTSCANANHKHSKLFKNTAEYKSISDTLSSIEENIDSPSVSLTDKMIVSLFRKIRDNVDKMFDNETILLTTHTSSYHSINTTEKMIPDTFTEEFDSGISGSNFYKMYNMVKGLEYYVLHCVVDGSDGFHRHLPCTISAYV